MGALASAATHGVLVPIRNVHVLHGDGRTEDRRSVRCPAHDRAVTLERCLSCTESGGLAHVPAAAGGPRLEYAACRHAGVGAGRAAGAEGAGALDETRVSEVMTADVLAVAPDVSLEALAGVFVQRGIGGAPVMNDEGRPIGVVSTTDLVIERYVAGDTGEGTAPGWQLPRDAPGVEVGQGGHVEAPPGQAVGDVMTRSALTVPETAPLAQAAALMAVRGIHRVLVVSEDGALSGIVTTSDVARWVAEQGGFLRPGA